PVPPKDSAGAPEVYRSWYRVTLPLLTPSFSATMSSEQGDTISLLQLASGYSSGNPLVAAAVWAYVSAVVAWRPVRIVHLARVEGICLGAIAFRVLHERGPPGFIAEAIGLLTDLLTDIALCPLALAGSESKCIEVLVLSGHCNCRTEQQCGG